MIDASGRVVTPGFVDLHGHYDGQMTWDTLLEPSTAHGVTTLIMGNCGVGFAPVRPGRHAALIELMEGVEDIPGAALWEGMTWGWESFPQYLDLLEGRRWSIDVGTQVPHGAVRNYVMGDRCGGIATADDVSEMSSIVREAIESGAFGFTTSRTLAHKDTSGEPVPGTYAADAELMALARSVVDGGGGIFEVAGSGLAPIDDAAMSDREVDGIGRIADATGLAATFVLLQCDDAPTRWREDLDRAAIWRGRGARVLPLIAGRSAGVLWGWAVRHPFSSRPTYRRLAHLDPGRPLRAAQAQGHQGGDPHGEGRVPGLHRGPARRRVGRTLARCFTLVDPPDYEQPPEQTMGRAGRHNGDQHLGARPTTRCSATAHSCCCPSTTTPPVINVPCMSSSKTPTRSSDSATAAPTR